MELLDNPFVRVAVGYLLIGAIVTLAFWAYLEYRHPAPDKPLTKLSFAEKLVLYPLMLAIMSASWIVLYPTLALLAANKRPPYHNPEEDYE